jgi:hypothetical protein
MSGGFIKKQGAGAHQVIFFTLMGALTDDDVKAWNDAIKALKDRFPTNLVGVTMQGDVTPRNLRQRRP